MLVTPDMIRRLRAIVAPIAERLGLELVAVEIVGGPSGRPILRVSIDRARGENAAAQGPAAHVGIHECTQLSRQLSPTLDVEDPIASAYELEVSTPGIERPVQSEADFQRFAGCEIRVKPYGVEARKRVKGTLLGVQDGLVRVRLAPTGGAATRGSAGTRSHTNAGAPPTGDASASIRQFPLDTIERANLALTLDQFRRLGEGLPLLPQESP